MMNFRCYSEHLCVISYKEIALSLLSWEWSKIIQSIASISMVWIAYKALTTWKQKSTADNKISFIGELSDEIHNFIVVISPAIEVYRFIKIGIGSHSSQDHYNNIKNRPISAAYIEKYGKEDGHLLFEKLNSCTSSVSKINSLITKGQIYNFIKYEDCQNSCALLTWQYDRLQAVAGLISQQSWNWENTKVVETLNKVLSTEIGDIEQNIKQQNIKFIEFAKDNYCSVFKNT
ncbi:hypothetical protein BTURTLESOX_2425 [bacterium endosymbiont of Bathymodiolus sp. 5 South]|nr:hypothetical protein BTURTLESOX_2425 [bacterium endosymbiont of Bathymodiolus sp. 5 South]